MTDAKPSLPSKLLVATNNRGKFPEIQSLLKTLNIEAISAFEFGLEEPEEIGKTFAENALIKAKFYANKTGFPAIADDSGLCIEAMQNRPGIHSARFAFDEKIGKTNFPYAFEKIFSELEAKGFTKNSAEKPRAFFICNLAIFDPKTGLGENFEGEINGVISLEPRGSKGFGYDPIFIKDGLEKTFGEIDPNEKDAISHRAVAFRKLADWWNFGRGGEI